MTLSAAGTGQNGGKMNSWHTYPSIYNLGHRAVADLLTVPCNVEEKVDGSQFSFSLTEEGELCVRSKGKVMAIDHPEKMFSQACATVQSLAEVLEPGWTYRAEYLQKPKHNTLAYNRIPRGHLIIFDINSAEECYLNYADKSAEAKRLGLECVPLLSYGKIASAEELFSLLERDSILGSTKIEGVVIKPIGYGLFGPDKKAIMGKFVSEAFKESHKLSWKASNPTGVDIVESIGQALRTEARWQKAIQHLRETGKLEDSPRDIGPLLKAIQSDIAVEQREEIMTQLFKWAWPQIQRKCVAGFPEWYKEQLLKRQFASIEEVTND